AIEGLSIAAPIFIQWLVPLSYGILAGLFMVQRHGTATMGKVFAPLTMLWFLSIGGFGLWSIIQTPSVLWMVNPYWAYHFVVDQPYVAFLTMGAVILTMTGGEAIYADLGHFGRLPIRLAWDIVVLPCSLLNYAGQGDLLLRSHEALANPVYMLMPDWVMFPMVGLATAAAVIASQAVITGVFSIVNQDIQLRYLPRLSVKHTSALERGQIYLHFIIWMLFISVLILILLFENSANL